MRAYNQLSFRVTFTIVAKIWVRQKKKLVVVLKINLEVRQVVKYLCWGIIDLITWN